MTQKKNPGGRRGFDPNPTEGTILKTIAPTLAMAARPTLLKHDRTAPLPTLNRAIGDLIAEKAHDNGFTLADLARSAHMPPKRVYRLRRGIGRTKVADLWALAETMKISLTDLWPADGTYLSPGRRS